MFRNMLIVDKFLCFTLETGGLVISWFLMTASIIVELVINYSIVRSLIDCKNEKKPPSNDAKNDHDDVDGESCFQVTSSGIFAVISLIVAVLIIFCILSIKGTKERNYRLIKPLIVGVGTLTIGSIISILSNPLSGIILFILNAYMYVVLYSLYLQLIGEHVRPDSFDLPEMDANEKV